MAKKKGQVLASRCGFCGSRAVEAQAGPVVALWCPAALCPNHSAKPGDESRRQARKRWNERQDKCRAVVRKIPRCPDCGFFGMVSKTQDGWAIHCASLQCCRSEDKKFKDLREAMRYWRRLV